MPTDLVAETTHKWRRRLLWNLALCGLGLVFWTLAWFSAWDSMELYAYSGPGHDHGPSVLEPALASAILDSALAINGVLALAFAYHAVRAVGASRWRTWQERGPREF